MKKSRIESILLIFTLCALMLVTSGCTSFIKLTGQSQNVQETETETKAVTKAETKKNGPSEAVLSDLGEEYDSLTTLDEGITDYVGSSSPTSSSTTVEWCSFCEVIDNYYSQEGTILQQMIKDCGNYSELSDLKESAQKLYYELPHFSDYTPDGVGNFVDDMQTHAESFYEFQILCISSGISS